MNSPKYSIGSAVFVKMRGYPAWPARVEGIADATPDKVKYHIFFYGTNQIAVSKEEDMCSYLKYREMLGKPKKAKGFNQAILKMDVELGLIPDSSDTIKKETVDCERTESNLTCVRVEDISNMSDIGLQEGILIENPSTTLNKNKMSNPYKQPSDLYGVLSTLKLECHLETIHYGIQSSLNLKKADPETCLQYLHELANVKLNKLTLKKHPEIVHTLFKAQTYIGNTNNWNMSDNDITVFKSQAEMIQNESKLICDQIKDLFQAPQGVSFLDYFESEVNTFKSHTKNMSLDDFFRLTTDPTDACFSSEEAGV